MSKNSSYSSFVKKIIEKDRELRKRMEDVHGESEEMYKLFKERHFTSLPNLSSSFTVVQPVIISSTVALS
jgi:hypothetical protein